MNWQFIFAWFKIVLLDLTLAGDNAVVIAMAVRTLPSREQRAGIVFGALGAVTVRVILTFAAAQLLVIPSLQFLGGLLLIWIAFKLLGQEGDDTIAVQDGTTLLKAVRIIIVADLIMSTDNILAIAVLPTGAQYCCFWVLALVFPSLCVEPLLSPFS
jgi:YjbE family integral membrane protein